VFNRKIGSTDEAATFAERTESLLFYSSTCGDALEEQLERLSMCEAFIDLCRSFDAKAPCEAVFLDNHAYAMYECEPDTWIVVCCTSRLGDMNEEELVNLTSSAFATFLYRPPAMPISSKKSPIGKLPFRRNTSHASMLKRQTKSQGAGVSAKDSDDIRIVETADPSVNVLRALLHRVYKLFLLYHGPISLLLWPEGSEDVPAGLKELRKILRKTRHLQELVDEGDLNPDPEQAKLLRERETNEDRLASMLAKSTADRVRENMASFLPALLAQVDFSRLHLLYEDFALPFAPLEKDVMVSVQLLMDRLQFSFSPRVQKCALIRAGEVIWSSLPMAMMRSIYMLLDIILYERTGTPTSVSATGSRSRIQGSRLATADGDLGEADSGLANRHSYPLSPGFLRLGSTGELNEHSRPIDSTEVYFPALFHAEDNVFQRVAAYGLDDTIMVVLLPHTERRIMQPLERSTSPEWNKIKLLDFAGQLEGFLHKEMVNLVHLLSDGKSTLTEQGSPQVTWGNVSGSLSSSSRQDGQSTAGSFSASSVEPNLISRAGWQFGQGGLQVMTQPRSLGKSIRGPGGYGASTTEQGEFYLYLNESSNVVTISEAWLSTLSRPNAISYPSNHDIGLLFSSNLITAMNSARHEFSADTTKCMLIIEFVCPNTCQHQPGCWLVAMKSGSRQVFLIVDPKHSFEHVSHRSRVLRETAFSSILL